MRFYREWGYLNGYGCTSGEKLCPRDAALVDNWELKTGVQQEHPQLPNDWWMRTDLLPSQSAAVDTGSRFMSDKGFSSRVAFNNLLAAAWLSEGWNRYFGRMTELYIWKAVVNLRRPKPLVSNLVNHSSTLKNRLADRWPWLSWETLVRVFASQLFLCVCLPVSLSLPLPHGWRESILYSVYLRGF